MKHINFFLLAFLVFHFGFTADAQVTSLKVNGVSSNFTMVQGDTLKWEIDLPVGGTAIIELWFDLNSNGVIDPTIDKNPFGSSISMTDGSSTDGLEDMDGLVNGSILFKFPIGLPPGKYIIKATHNGVGLSISGTVTAMPSPAFTVSGKVTPPPGYSALNILLYAAKEDEPSGIALTDADGNYTLNFNASFSGKILKINVEYDVSPYSFYPQKTTLTMNKNYTGIDFVAMLSTPQTSQRYHETFTTNNENGWAFLASSANISAQNGKITFSSSRDKIVYVLPPIGATKDDFSIRAVSNANCEGAFGRMGFKSFIGIHIDDSIHVIYSENIQSYENPNFIRLASEGIWGQVINFQLDVTRSGNNLIIKAYVNEEKFYDDMLYNVNEGLFYGQIVTTLIKKEERPIEFSLDEIDIKYNPAIETPGVFMDGFDNPHSPWFRFGDNDNIAQSVTISSGKLNFNYSGTSDTYLYVIPPVGAVRDFSIEVEGGAGSLHNAPFGISRFFDYRNYTTMWFEDDTLYIGYAINSSEPTIINKVRFASSITKLKFSVEGNAPTLNLKVWANDALVLTGTINNATERLASGHIALGYDRGNTVNAYLNYASINYTKFVTSINEKRVSLVTDYVLLQNYPNPFNPSTAISYQLSAM